LFIHTAQARAQSLSHSSTTKNEEYEVFGSLTFFVIFVIFVTSWCRSSPYSPCTIL
jgi:hypothetical protein